MNRGLWTATACWSNSCNLMTQIADLLGETEDKAYYEGLKGEINDAYADRFLQPDGRMKALKGPMSRYALGKEKEFQSGYVLPVAFDMLQPKMKQAALDNLVRMVEAGDYRIRTGFPSTPFILFALADNDRADVAFQMLMNESCPSWLHEVKAGGTTIWERWDALREDGTCNTGSDDGTNGMTSFNHYASGAVGEFLYRRIAGLEPIEPGYRCFAVKPLVGGGLTHATATLHTPYGKAASAWRMENGRFTIAVTVPVSTQCPLTLPDGSTHTLGSGQYQFACAMA